MCATWTAVRAGNPPLLLSKVVEVLCQHLVSRPLEVLMSGRQGGSKTIVQRMKQDLQVLRSPPHLNDLKVIRSLHSDKCNHHHHSYGRETGPLGVFFMYHSYILAATMTLIGCRKWFFVMQNIAVQIEA